MNKWAIIIILSSLIGFYCVNVYLASTKYFQSIHRQDELLDTAKALVYENESLKAQNNELKNDYFLLKMHFDSIYVSHQVIRSLDKNPLPEAIISIEHTIKETHGWGKPRLIYDMLSATLGRQPTDIEYRTALNDLVSKSLIHHDTNNSSVKYNLVKFNQIDSITHEYCTVK